MWRLIPVQSKVGGGTHTDSRIGGGGVQFNAALYSCIRYTYSDRVRQYCILACTFIIIGSNIIRHTYYCYWWFISFCENSSLSHVPQIGLLLLLVLFQCSMVFLCYFNLYCPSVCWRVTPLVIWQETNTVCQKWNASMKMRAYSGCMFGLTYCPLKTSLPVSSSHYPFPLVEYSCS